MPPHIYTIPPGRPFLRTLAEAILGGHLPSPGAKIPRPLDLAGMTLLLPTRRAARAVCEAFLAASGGNALLLPRIRPIAEGEEDLSLLASVAAREQLDATVGDVPPAIPELERRLVLTELVLKWSEAMRASSTFAEESVTDLRGATPAQAAQLASELGRLMDGVETENVSLANLKSLVPEHFSAHWEKTLQFLQIVLEWWPAYLDERGSLSSADRRNRIVLAEAERLTKMPPASPIIIAGITGSIPATAELMRAVAKLPNGAIVLPAIDHALDDVSWSAIVPDHPEHPQFGLKKLLDRLGVDRRDVAELPGAVLAAPARARLKIVSEAMRPAATTEAWHAFATTTDTAALRSALTGVSYIEAPSAPDEAEAVSLILREALETPGRTAVLVTPDRVLGRRVAVRLESWGIRVDDSAGRPFTKTVPGVFLTLIADAVASDYSPAALMALLKHPLTRLGLSVRDVRRAARVLELGAFRTSYLGRGLDGVEAALERAIRELQGGARRDRAFRRIPDVDVQAARDLVQRLKLAVAPLADVFGRFSDLFGTPKLWPLRTIAEAHVKAADAISLPPDDGAAPLVWQGDAGEAANLFFTGLLQEGLRAPAIAATDYPDFMRGLLQDETVRPRVPVNRRVAIWGPFEARLQQPDVVVLGSLNEGTWPETGETGPWLNRPMRQELGLPAPEEKIGFSAHDFTSLLGAEAVYLTRAAKLDGNPTVPSRWILRFQALLGGANAGDALAPAQPWLAWARARDRIAERRTVKAPAPCPAVALRPRKLSISGVETWLANPYAIFANHILNLEALPLLGAEPDAALKGSIIHAALGRFAAAYPNALPPYIKAALMEQARAVLDEYAAHPRVAAFWLPRFARFADWFEATEPERRPPETTVHAEVGGSLVLEGPAGAFTLRARADRIDAIGASLAIYDYKTGQIPSKKRVKSGAAPQLPLEAAIALAGGFTGLGERAVTTLAYIRVTGGEPPGEVQIIEPDNADIAALAATSRDGLARLIARFDDPSTPYRALRRASFADTYRFDDYAHLARVAEWSAETGEDE